MIHWRRGELPTPIFLGSSWTQLVKNLPAVPGEGKGYSLQYSGLDSSMDCIVHGVAKSQTRLSDVDFTHFLSLINYTVNIVQ